MKESSCGSNVASYPWLASEERARKSLRSQNGDEAVGIIISSFPFSLSIFISAKISEVTKEQALRRNKGFCPYPPSPHHLHSILSFGGVGVKG